MLLPLNERRSALDYLITFKIVLLVFLFILSGFFSCSEAALFSLTPLHLHKMQEERFPVLSSIRGLLNYPQRLLITLIVGNEAVNIALSVLMASLFIQWLGIDGQWVSIAFTTSLLLVFGEAIPKTFGVTYPIRLSSISAPLLVIVSWCERPVVWILEKVSGLIVSLFPGGYARQRGSLTEDEFRVLVDTGEKEGSLEPSQRDLIHGVFELGDKPVSEIMIPRVDMVCLPASLSAEDMAREVIKARHERIPVCGTDRDDIRGILLAKELLHRVASGGRILQIEELLRKAYFVPENRSAAAMLRDFQTMKIKMAIVVDEYGGVSGLVTLEDILEDLLEDIYDNYGLKTKLWQKVDEQTFLVSGKMPMDGFSELTGLVPPTEDFDTVGGFVFHLFGKLPAKGENVCFEKYTFRVEKMGGTRILILRVEKKENTIQWIT
jgi:CBS domain containing-hemolysin-like protein